MIKSRKMRNTITYLSFAVALIAVAFLLSSDTSNAVCRAPDGCVGCHEDIGNVTYIVREAAGTCERGDFTVAPNMTLPRFIHRVAKLQDGRLLLTGGARAIWVITPTVDIYDPATNAVSSAAPMNIARWSHGIATLNDGRVLVIGGRTSVAGSTPGANVQASAELYDPATDTWTFTGSMSTARRSPTVTLLQDGRVLVAGGLDRASSGSGLPLSSVEIYDPATETFSFVGNMTTPRNAQGAVLLDDGTVLINGGSIGQGTAYPSNLSEIYDPSDNSFTAVGPSNFSHLAQVGVKMRDGRVLIPGSYYNDNHLPEQGKITPECEIYDPATQTFTPTGSMYKQRIDVGGQLLLDGTVFVSGGVSTHPDRIYPTMFQTSSEIYDPETGIWLLSGLMRDGRDEFSGIQLDDGRIFVSGGYTRTNLGAALLDTIEIYTPGLYPQVKGIINVIEDLPDSALKKGHDDREELNKKIEKVGEALGMAEDDLEGETLKIGGGGFDGKHVVKKHGVYHRPGFYYPEINCAGCHGEDLKGDIGPSCNTCHGNKWLEERKATNYTSALDKANALLNYVNSHVTSASEKKKVEGVVSILINSINKVLAPNTAPTVSITAVPTSGTEPLVVDFTSTASDSDGTVDSYYWQFGDGKTSTAANPAHTYSCDGTYIATLRVTDNNGGTAQASVTVTIAAASAALTFDCDVAPIMQKYCVGCHGSFGGLNLQSCEGLLAGGDSGAVVVPGDSASSLLYTEIASGDMPPSGAAVSAADVARIGAWIDSLNPADPDFCD